MHIQVEQLSNVLEDQGQTPEPFSRPQSQFISKSACFSVGIEEVGQLGKSHSPQLAESNCTPELLYFFFFFGVGVEVCRMAEMSWESICLFSSRL